MAKKLNERGEELFTTAFKVWKNKDNKKTKYIYFKHTWCVPGKEDVIYNIRVERIKGNFTIISKNYVIQGTAKPIQHEQFRVVYPYMITIMHKKRIVFKCDWSTFELTARITLVKKH